MVNAILNALVHRAMWFGIVMVGAGGVYAYDQYDKRTNFVPVQARVVDVKETCYMERRAGRRTTTSDTLACNLARDMVQNHPSWQGFQVKQQIVVNYEYVSPADKRTHSGKRTLSAYPNGKKLSSGEILNVRASKTDPNKSREI